jgi:hypothetical protein
MDNVAVRLLTGMVTALRPAVVVDSGGAHCDVVADVATAAAKLYT